MVKRISTILFLIIFLNGKPVSSAHLSHFFSKTEFYQDVKRNDTIPYGKWRVVSFKMGNGDPTITAKQAQGYINKIIIISEDSIVGLDGSCHRPEYTVSRVNVEEYLINWWKVTYNIGIKQDSITLVTAEGYDDKYHSFVYYKDYLLLGKDKMILPEPGPFFLLERIK